MTETTVRVVVKIANPGKEAERVTFDYNTFGADPQIGDILCFGEIHLQIKERRLHVMPDRAPRTVLHTGITDRRPSDLLTTHDLVGALKGFPCVDSIVLGKYL
jgi:hypothetical protein